MWWGQHSEGRRGGGAIWFIVFFAIAIALMSSRGWSWGWWWLVFLVPCFLGPKIWRSMNDEKRKNDAEKPKRSFTGNDGEQYEIIDEEPQPQARRTPPDDIEYV